MWNLSVMEPIRYWSYLIPNLLKLNLSDIKQYLPLPSLDYSQPHPSIPCGKNWR